MSLALSGHFEGRKCGIHGLCLRIIGSELLQGGHDLFQLDARDVGHNQAQVCVCVAQSSRVEFLNLLDYFIEPLPFYVQ